MAACTSGSSTPWAARKTIVPERPPVPRSGKCSSRTSKPRALSDPGTSAVALNADPVAPAATANATIASTHTPTTTLHRSKHQPATRGTTPRGGADGTDRPEGGGGTGGTDGTVVGVGGAARPVVAVGVGFGSGPGGRAGSGRGCVVFVGMAASSGERRGRHIGG